MKFYDEKRFNRSHRKTCMEYGSTERFSGLLYQIIDFPFLKKLDKTEMKKQNFFFILNVNGYINK